MHRLLLALGCVCLVGAAPAAAAELRGAARIRQAVFLVRPHYHDQTRALFKRIAGEFHDFAARAQDPQTAETLRYLEATYQSHAESPAHGSGWMVIDSDGAAWVVTNKHVAGEAEYVTLESAVTAYRPIERCPVVYVDPKLDLAVIAVPQDALPPDVVGFEVSTGALTEGDPVAAAGFPGGVPGQLAVYQYTEGIVNNAEFPMPDGVVAVQHSATIDPGNSGGPLLVPDPAARIGYRVVGVNTWGLKQRTNVNLSIRASDAAAVLDRARAAQRLRRDGDRLSSELRRTAQLLAQEMGSGSPDVAKLHHLMSYGVVARHGAVLFDAIVANADKLSDAQARAFQDDPVEFMRTQMFVLFVANYAPQQIAGMKLERIYDSDLSELSERGTVRTLFSTNGRTEEVAWAFEHGSWKIADATFTQQAAQSSGQPQVSTTPQTKPRGTGGSGITRPTTPEPDTRGVSLMNRQKLDRARGGRIGRSILETLGGGLLGTLGAGGVALALGVATDDYFIGGLAGMVTYVFLEPAVTMWIGRAMGGLGGYWLGVTMAACAMAISFELPEVGLVLTPFAVTVLFEMQSMAEERKLEAGGVALRDVAVLPFAARPPPGRQGGGGGLALVGRF